MRTLSTEARKAIAKAVELGTKADRATVVAVDFLIAEGFDKPTDYQSPKGKDSTVTVEEWDHLKETVVLGFTKTAQGLLAKPTKSLSDAHKAEKRYWQQQINSRIGDFKKQVAKRINGADSESDGAGSKPRSTDQRVRDKLNETLKIVEKSEDANFNVPDMVKAVKAALKLIK